MFINNVFDDNLMISRSYHPDVLKRRSDLLKPLWSVNGLFNIRLDNN